MNGQWVIGSVAWLWVGLIYTPRALTLDISRFWRKEALHNKPFSCCFVNPEYSALSWFALVCEIQSLYCVKSCSINPLKGENNCEKMILFWQVSCWARLIDICAHELLQDIQGFKKTHVSEDVRPAWRAQEVICSACLCCLLCRWCWPPW